MSMKKFIMRIYFILMTFGISFEPLFYVQGKAEKKNFFWSLQYDNYHYIEFIKI